MRRPRVGEKSSGHGHTASGKGEKIGMRTTAGTGGNIGEDEDEGAWKETMTGEASVSSCMPTLLEAQPFSMWSLSEDEQIFGWCMMQCKGACLGSGWGGCACNVCRHWIL